MLAAVGVEREHAVVAEGRGRAADRRPRRKLAAAVLQVEIRRREDLEVAAQIAGRLAGAADPSAAGQHAPVGQQHRHRVVLARDAGGSELGPCAGRGIPPLGRVGRVGEIDEPAAAVGPLTAGGQHAAVGEHGQVVLAAARDQRAGGGRDGRAAAGVDDARGARRHAGQAVLADVAAARHEEAADVEVGIAAVPAADPVAVPAPVERAYAVRVDQRHRGRPDQPAAPGCQEAPASRGTRATTAS